MTICLNMIVKNESPVIQRCLASVKNRIDYWVIVDTGSTDGTQYLIRECLKGVPGELYEKPWIDYSHNRNEALAFAKNKADYLLFIDADQVLEFASGGSWPLLNRDCYYVHVHSDFRYSAQYILLISNHRKMTWKGVLHEVLVNDAVTFSVFQDIQILAFSDGHQSKDPLKYLKHAEILERGLVQEPNNSRYIIFLALTYDVAKKYDVALYYFEKRSLMGGRNEEVFYSLFGIANMQRRLGQEPTLFIASYQKAYEYRPTRSEPLFWMADHYIAMQDYEQGYVLAKKAAQIQIPITDQIYVEFSIYQYEALLQLLRCSYQTKRYQESYEVLLCLQSNSKLPETIRMQVEDILPHVKEFAMEFSKN
jgi:glycosyltransferase involved in cell wall biosynthesis